MVYVIRLIFAFYLAIICAARRNFPSLIPNGNASGLVCPNLGHYGCGTGRYTLNHFGRDFEDANFVWTEKFCNTDSDGDSVTNGAELGDPCCVWTPGTNPSRTTDLSAPGDAFSTPKFEENTVCRKAPNSDAQPLRAASPVASPCPSPTRTPAPSASPSPFPTRTPAPSASPSPSPTRTPVPSASPSPSPSRTPVRVSKPRNARSVRFTITPAATPKIMAVAKPLPSGTPSGSPSSTMTASATSTMTSSATATRTPSTTPPTTPSTTPSMTRSPTPSMTPSTTPSMTRLATPTMTPSRTPSTTRSAAPTMTPSATSTRSYSPSATSSVVSTPSPSADTSQCLTIEDGVCKSPVSYPVSASPSPSEVTRAGTLSSASASPFAPHKVLEEPGRTEIPTPTETPFCFPADATLVLESGDIRTMEQLRTGDRVAVGRGKFSEVFAFTHQQRSGLYDMVKLTTRSGESITLTVGHVLYVSGRMARADNVGVGDSLELQDGTNSKVMDVQLVRKRGLYNPQTRQGDIAVSGIRASTYTSAIAAPAAHALLAPIRGMYQVFGYSMVFLNTGRDSARHLAAAILG